MTLKLIKLLKINYNVSFVKEIIQHSKFQSRNASFFIFLMIYNFIQISALFISTYNDDFLIENEN